MYVLGVINKIHSMSTVAIIMFIMGRGQSASQICIGEPNASRFWGREDKMVVSSNHISMKNNAE